MRNILASLLLLSFTGAAASALAAGPMKPGLWEMNIKSDMMKNMPKIPPGQMEQMRKMGVEVPKFTEGGMTTKMCMTKEMTERNEPPEMNRKESGCESKNYKRSGNTYSLDIVCSGPNMAGTGKVQGSFNGDQSFASSYDFKGTAHGHPVSHHQESTGKWLSADCGNVKPMDGYLQRKR